MKTRSDQCDPDRLRLLAEDRLPADEMAGLEQHLERCARCREELDRLVGDDHCLGAVRRHLGSEPTVWHGPGHSGDESLGFLTPSDWPDSLGRLGTYEVKGVLGRGGMGVVLKAFDPALSRSVAVKVMSAPLASCAAARQRFLREARAAAAVVHEHVVGVYAVAEAAGLPFLVMEYVPGRSLQDRLDKQGHLPLLEVLRIGMQTAAGLAAAHAQGLVHRDVKPANILLEDGVERVRLTDFGLARAAADAGMTRSGVVAGTPHYMAPEQARGEPTDHRADLFSLGSTLYAACAGHPPFRAESPLAVLRRVADDLPRPIREINPDVPAWFEAILARLMAKEPAGRFRTAAEVADLLAGCLAHVQQPLAVPLPEAVVRASARPGPGSPRRVRWTIAATAILLLVGGGTLALLRPWAAPLQTIAPPRHTASPDRAPGGADQVAQELRRAWEQAEALRAGLHGGGDRPGRDEVSERADRLAARMRSLEQELTTGGALP
jgi:serine/threonine-protein kinase